MLPSPSTSMPRTQLMRTGVIPPRMSATIALEAISLASLIFSMSSVLNMMPACTKRITASPVAIPINIRSTAAMIPSWVVVRQPTSVQTLFVPVAVAVLQSGLPQLHLQQFANTDPGVIHVFPSALSTSHSPRHSCSQVRLCGRLPSSAWTSKAPPSQKLSTAAITMTVFCTSCCFVKMIGSC